MVKVKENLIGRKFGLLTVIRQIDDYITPKGRRHARWWCRCECGNELAVVGYHLKEKNKIKSCGCYTIPRIQEIQKEHNEYDMDNYEYGVGYTNKGIEFWFDKEDYDLIKNYCWSYSDYGYLVAWDQATKKKVNFHRLVMGVMENDNVRIVDHKIHPPRKEPKIDNRKSNLRIVTHYENAKNHQIYSNNTSGVSGVTYNKQNDQWVARISVNGERIFLGYFNKKEDAINARYDAEIKYYGEYRCYTNS